MAEQSLNLFELDEDFMRNCPTPELSTLSDNDLNFDAFDAFDDELNFNPSANMGQNIAPIPQAAMSSTPFLSMDTCTPMLATNDNVTQQSSSFANISPSFNFNIQNDTNSFIPIQAGSSREDDNKTPLYIFKEEEDEDSLTFTKNSRKEKCMTRNAVLARQNREKKKGELHSLMNKMGKLEEENASLLKKCTEYKKSYENVLERNKYLEAIIQNLPQIVNMVEHMSLLPGGKSSNSNKKT